MLRLASLVLLLVSTTALAAPRQRPGTTRAQERIQVLFPGATVGLANVLPENAQTMAATLEAAVKRYPSLSSRVLLVDANNRGWGSGYAYSERIRGGYGLHWRLEKYNQTPRYGDHGASGTTWHECGHLVAYLMQDTGWGERLKTFMRRHRWDDEEWADRFRDLHRGGRNRELSEFLAAWRQSAL